MLCACHCPRYYKETEEGFTAAAFNKCTVKFGICKLVLAEYY